MLLLLAGPALAVDDFPLITPQEKALTAVPGEPNAPAVVLSRKAELLMMGYGSRGQDASRLFVRTRLKILTQEGVRYGEAAIPHSDSVRLTGLQGRTVLPDGRILPLPADAKFERKLSKRQKRSLTSVAFPGVEVGAILDYQYELSFESIFFLEPWYFSDEVPVLFAEVVFKIPTAVKAKVWSSDPFKVGLQSETYQAAGGTEIRVWAKNLPAIPEEPFSPPFSHLATQMMLLPTAYDDGAHKRIPLLESWASACGLFDERYQKAQRREGDAPKKAREIAGRVTGTRARAEALYRFVRDEIATEPSTDVWLEEGATVGKALAEKRGSSAEKGLLLQAMLEAAGVKSRLVWAASRWNARIDPELANPGWFDRMLVAAEVDGQRVFLDPADRSLAFGQLQSGYEGTPAVIVDTEAPEVILLPETPFEQNARRAVLDLALDEEGALAGSGELVLTGHHAWERIDWQADDARTQEAWQKWLTEESPGFVVSEVRFEERPDDQMVRLTWKLAQREEDVLGDEVSLAPSRPLGPVAQPFVQTSEQRRSPVVFAYGDRDEVELRLRWPEGWRIEATPSLAKQERPVGSFVVEVEEMASERRLVYRRRLDLPQRKLGSAKDYEAVRALYAAVEKSDAQPLALVRR
jgi:transglutaminase-like putative cysteine protease